MQKKIILGVVAGFLLGALWIVALRFFMYKNTDVHHHADFALYVNGVQDKFDNFTFYEEVQSCGSDELNNPRTRVHLHDNVGYVAHVHDNASTWSHLFTNLGYTLGDDVLSTDAGVFVDNQDNNELRFWLNGEEVESVANRYMASEDVLLINYGQDSDEVMEQRYDDITKDAAEYNLKNDPSACSGTKQKTFGQRLKRALNFSL